MARLHPYNFAHILLPQLAWRRPVAVRHELSEPELAHDLLQYVWDKTAESLPKDEQVPSRGLQLTWHEVAGRATALIQLPPPQSTGDVYFVALVYDDEQVALGEEEEDMEDDEEDGELEAQRPRYFTLEATLGLAHDHEGPPTMVGERRGDVYRHLQRGPGGGQARTVTAFLEMLANVLGPMPGAGLPFMRVVRS